MTALEGQKFRVNEFDQKAIMTTSLFLVLSLTLMTTESTGSLIYSGCRPRDNWAFDLKCNQTQLTWIRSAFFAATTDDGRVDDICYKAAPNRTSECIPDRNLNTRNLRVACNTIRGQCKPNGPDETMNSNTFKNCSTYGFTYAYAVYDCLPGDDSSGRNFNYTYLSSVQEDSWRNSSEKVYLMSAYYDNKGYTNSPISRCWVTVSFGTNLSFTVLDLRGETTAGAAIDCPYTLYINSGTASPKEWCAGQDYSGDSGDSKFDVSAGNNWLTVNVTFNAYQGSSSVQGRVWILVEASRTDGSSANILTSCGLNTSTTSTTTTMTTTTTTPPTTTTTTPTTTTTTTPPTTTTTTSTSTTTTTPTTTSTTTAKNTPISTTSSTTTTTSPVYAQGPTSSESTSTTDMSYLAKEAASSNNVVSIAIGVSVAVFVVLCIVASVTVYIFLIYQKKKKKRSLSSNGRELSSALSKRQRYAPFQTVSSSISNQGSLSSEVVSTTESGSAAGEDIYDQIDEKTIGSGSDAGKHNNDQMYERTIRSGNESVEHNYDQLHENMIGSGNDAVEHNFDQLHENMIGDTIV